MWGDDDVGDRLAGDGAPQRLDMVGVVRAGVDHRDLALPHHVGVGAVKGERARVVADDPADAGRHGPGPPVFEPHLLAERNVGLGHRTSAKCLLDVYRMSTGCLPDAYWMTMLGAGFAAPPKTFAQIASAIAP